jgi:hypothetical protein
MAMTTAATTIRATTTAAAMKARRANGLVL